MCIFLKRTTVLVTLVIISLVLPAAYGGVGSDNPLAVFLTVPAREYDIGSEVTVGIWVYKEGVPYDAPLVIFEVGRYYDARSVNVSHVGMGEFESTFTIEEDDLGSTSSVYLRAGVWEGNGYWDDNAADSTYIYLPRLEIDLQLTDPADQFTAPGRLVEFQVRTRFKGVPVDPDPGTLVVKLIDAAGKEFEMITDRVDTGEYEGSCSISTFQKASEVYEIEAEAKYTWHSTTQTAIDVVTLWSDFYQIYVNVVESSIHGCELEIHALDMDGDPLIDARVILNITYFDDAKEVISIKVSDYTDLDGKAGFREPFTAVGQDETHVYIYGNVTLMGLTQSFEGKIRVMQPQLSPPTGNWFRILTLEEDPVVPGKTSTVDSFAYYDGDPLPDTPIYIYVLNGREVYYNGNVTTDSQGRFEYPLTVPEHGGVGWGPDRYVIAYYHAKMPGYYANWYHDIEMIHVGDPSLRYFTDHNAHSWTEMDVSPYQPGGEVTVTLSDREADGSDERAVIYWGVGSVDDVDNMLDPDAPEAWSSWTGSDIPHLYPVPATWDGESYIGTFHYPEFLSLDTEIFVLGTLTAMENDRPELRTALVEGLKVDLQPELALTPDTFPEVAAGIVEINGTATDDNALESIEYRIDGDEWKNALGAGEWGFTMDTIDMESGYHYVEIRGFDGVQYSEVMNVSFKVDQPPMVSIMGPVEGKKYIDKVKVWGLSGDDERVHYIEIKLDDGPWYKCYGIENWTYELSGDEMKLGNHTLMARSYDGHHYSPVQEVTFKITEEEQTNWLMYIIAMAIAIAVALVIALFVVRSRKGAAAAPARGGAAMTAPAPRSYSIQPDHGGRPVTGARGFGVGPGAVQGFILEVGDGKLRLKWYPPLDTGGGQLTGYRIYRGDHRNTLVRMLDVVPNATEYEDTGLSNGKSYYYAVSTLLGGMEGDMTDIQHGIPIGPPSHPVYPSGHVGDTSIVLSWRPPTKSGGSAIRGFVVLKGTSPEELRMHAELGYEFTYEDTEVVKGTTYYYAIMASNDSGWGEPTQLLIAKME